MRSLRSSILNGLIPALLTISMVEAIPSKNTTAVCNTLKQQFPDKVAWDTLGINVFRNSLSESVTYNDVTTDYWNVGNADNRAACMLFPSSASDVAFAVKTLLKYPDVRYATKGGGHMSNKGFSSVDQGVLIAFRPNMVSTTLSSDGNTANVQPGSKWDEAMTVLDPHGKAIVGGRLGHVGVAGYTIGGGLSFLTSQYGFAAENTVEYELVDATGAILTVNQNQNSDLFYALKGGGNQFGIITNFKFKTHNIGQVWGGTKIFTADKASALINATHDFTANFKDPKTAIITTFNFDRVNLVQVVFFFYDGPTPPKGAFGLFEGIQPLSNACKTQRYPDLLKANNAFSLSGMHYQIREATYPILPAPAGTKLLQTHYDRFSKFSLISADLLDFEVLSFAIQPIPVLLQQASIDAGGNRLGLDPKDGDRIFMEYDVSWINPLANQNAPAYIRQIETSISAELQATYADQKPTHYTCTGGNGACNRKVTNYNPIFMNDGMYDQPVLESYGAATYAKLKNIQRTRDPNGFFSKRQGGFGYNS